MIFIEEKWERLNFKRHCFELAYNCIIGTLRCRDVSSLLSSDHERIWAPVLIEQRSRIRSSTGNRKIAQPTIAWHSALCLGYVIVVPWYLFSSWISLLDWSQRLWHSMTVQEMPYFWSVQFLPAQIYPLIKSMTYFDQTVILGLTKLVIDHNTSSCQDVDSYSYILLLFLVVHMRRWASPTLTL